MPSAGDFLWVGNHPAPDLCNTTRLIDGAPVDLLTDLPTLLAWCRLAGLDVPEGARRMEAREARRTLSFARNLRDRLRVLLERPTTSRVAARSLNDLLAREPGALQVRGWGDGEPVALAAPTGPAQLRLDIAAATVDIFRHDPALIRRCASPACVLLFLDVSKSGRRRWCDMARCGNRAKVAAHYLRTR